MDSSPQCGHVEDEGILRQCVWTTVVSLAVSVHHLCLELPTWSRFICLISKLVTFTKTDECFPKPKTYSQLIYDYLYGVDDVPKQFNIEELWNEILVALSIRSPVVPNPTPLHRVINCFDELFLQTNVITSVVVMVTLLMLIYICVRRIDWGMKGDSGEAPDIFHDITNKTEQGDYQNRLSCMWMMTSFMTFAVLRIMVPIVKAFFWPLRKWCRLGEANLPWTNETKEWRYMGCSNIPQVVGRKRKMKKPHGKTISKQARLRPGPNDDCRVAGNDEGSVNLSKCENSLKIQTAEIEVASKKEMTTPKRKAKKHARFRASPKWKKNRAQKASQTARPKLAKCTNTKEYEDKQIDALISTLSTVLAELQEASRELEVTDNSDTWSVDLSLLSYEAHEDRIEREMI